MTDEKCFEATVDRMEDAPAAFFKAVDATIETLRKNNLKTGDVTMEYVGATISARIDLDTVN